MAEIKPLCGEKMRKDGRDHLYSDRPTCKRCKVLVLKMKIAERNAMRAANARKEETEE